MDLLQKAQKLASEGHDVIHMEVGEPDFPTPGPIIEAGRQALADQKTFYTPALGLPALRLAISEYYSNHYGVQVDPARIVITPGASGALLLIMALLVNSGDGVLLADPGYPCNRHFIQLYDGVPQLIPVGEDTRYQINGDLVAKHWASNTKAVLLASPSNPTGTLVPEEEYESIANEVARRSGFLIVDEIYHGLTYGMDAKTVLSVEPDAFVINSFSKFFGMTGWRLGWIIAPEDAVPELDKLAQNLFLAAPTPSQHAALAAFSQETMDILEYRREVFHQRRDALLPALKQLGFKIPVTPEGAFYLYADSSGLTDDSFDFAQTLLQEKFVAVTPGLDFGFNKPDKFIRFAYTEEKDRLLQAVDRIADFLR